jgi:5-methylcytosine-specific restriction endonuclease McrA
LSEQKADDLTGQRFERWTVVGNAGVDKHRRSLWSCVCICGAEKIVPGTVLKSGESKSCGCYLRDSKSTGRTPEEERTVRRERSRISAGKNPARRKANKIRYEKKLAVVTPDWLSAEDWTRMNGFYSAAREATRSTGVPHQVDHIIPINGEKVSGLHVPSNLRILTKSENVSKSNRYAEL